VIDVEATRLAQARLASFRPDLNEADECTVRIPFDFPAAPPPASQLCGDAWEQSANLKEEEFTRAEALGLFDYLRKSKSHGFVVSLSGGADSAATACLVHLMVAFGWKDLGEQGFKTKLAHVAKLSAAIDPQTATRVLLTTVYQASKNSGSVTRDAARSIASAIGAEHFEWEVGEIVSRYVETIEQATGTRLSWDQNDVALQNIQARVRSPGIWMLANLKNALLLSTSNRSEAAVGYATMDGDTSGGLSPLAGIDKAWLRCWLRWLEATGPEGLKPIPQLAAINCQAPTAELRPSESKQTDEEDLMPYEILDAVERLAIRDKQGPLEVFELLKHQFPKYPVPQLVTWIERFFRLWSRNQWKRERYAPSFHLDDENLDPKTWCRFPILSGGFEVELAELRARAGER
jgi:NAD+ synthase (glutamine-hydrolysing)